MTVYEMIQKLSKFNADCEVEVIACGLFDGKQNMFKTNEIDINNRKSLLASNIEIVVVKGYFE